MSAELNRLVDIRRPQQRDFSEKAGWALNAADYPVPQRMRVEARSLHRLWTCPEARRYVCPGNRRET